MNIYNEDDVTSTGYSMPSNPKMIMDEDEEEVTRKIAPAMVMPSRGPMPTIPPSRFWSSTFNTAPPSLEKQQLQLQQQQNKPRSASTISFNWKLSTVPDLPENHTLERSAVFVPNAEPAEVSSRISDVLRERSIETQYESGKGKVKCLTAEGVHFRIRLYRGRGSYNHGIIVEVQRRFGRSLVFYNDTKAILDGAEGNTACPPPPMFSYIPEVSDLEDDDEYEDYEDTTSSSSASAESSLMMVAKMMELSGFDSQYLGLQTLSLLVDSKRGLETSTAGAVATSLFRADSEVGKKVFNYVMKKSNKTKTSTTKSKRGVFDDDFDGEDEDEDDENFMMLRNLSLCILANAIKAYEKIPLVLRESLRPILIQDLYDAEKHPNAALLSAKSLEYFVTGDEDMAELNRAFQFAHKTGEARHANLMRQAKKCLDATNSC
mmetsp:Transcript_27232/g.59983  ORF Transcript_27232/g.59983 Transcript_27232/m.59983 type:complete len:433 (-) Transcript_27232:185-1483(-)